MLHPLTRCHTHPREPLPPSEVSHPLQRAPPPLMRCHAHSGEPSSMRHHAHSRERPSTLVPDVLLPTLTATSAIPHTNVYQVLNLLTCQYPSVSHCLKCSYPSVTSPLFLLHNMPLGFLLIEHAQMGGAWSSGVVVSILFRVARTRFIY